MTNALILHVDKVPIITGSDQWTAHAYISIGSHTPGPGGQLLLSADCWTPAEVHEWADLLIRDLEVIKTKATGIQWNNRPGAN